MPRIGIVAAHIGVGRFHRLDALVHFGGAVRTGRIAGRGFHDVEHLERRDAQDSVVIRRPATLDSP